MPHTNVTLEEAIAIALGNNKQVLSLKELIQAAQQRQLQYLAEYLPSAEFTANYDETEENFILNPQSVTSTIASMTSIQQLATLKIPAPNKFYDSRFNLRQLVISKEIDHKIPPSTYLKTFCCQKGSMERPSPPLMKLKRLSC